MEMRYLITNKQYNLLMESSEEEEKLLKVPELSFFANNWEILQAYLKSKGNPRYYIDGNLNLFGSDIKSLGNLVRVKGNLNLWGTNITSLGNLEYVGGDLDLFNTDIESLGNLVRVEGDLNLFKSKIESLGNLEYVGGYLGLKNTPLSKTTTKKEIRSKVDVLSDIYL
jgi:hypothetical protein